MAIFPCYRELQRILSFAFCISVNIGVDKAKTKIISLIFVLELANLVSCVRPCIAILTGIHITWLRSSFLLQQLRYYLLMCLIPVKFLVFALWCPANHFLLQEIEMHPLQSLSNMEWSITTATATLTIFPVELFKQGFEHLS